MSWFHTRWVLPFAEPERYANLTASLKSFRDFEQLPEAEQRSENLARVSRLLHHAHQSSPFYRFRMDASGVNPSAWDINSTIPLEPLTKTDLRVAGDAILCRSVSNEQLRAASTGGTTGAPARIWRTVEDLRQKVAMQIHLESQVGYAPGDSVLMIWGADRDLELNPSWKWKLYQQRLMHQYSAPVGMLNDQVFRRFGKLLQASSPQIVYGYSSCIARFAEYVERQKLKFKAPRRVLVTAEPLTPQDRELIQRVFRAPVREFYGSRDIGMVAVECSHGRLHFHPSACHVEFVPETDSSEGMLYRLYITDLLNQSFPMIRYDTEDCVLLADDPCPCGSWYPAVRRIVGRAIDNFVLGDGTTVPGVCFTTQLLRIRKPLRLINGLQFIQKRFDLTQIRYAAEGAPEHIRTELQNITECVNGLFPSGMNWEYVRVPKILREKSGKLRFTISEVSAAFP
ncbi:phenylacetate--CoA ligase family protein [Terriglobus roseus]|uniref:Phenylacetate-coenzyme A ligase PaaK, adenylate-forming domain family n=1 Tax=Terriglobus roseus TaxID=392734 RepID=A0A1H4SHR5_9BACT|nr:phenylacetate--CoA ligase family protein [Terriglobus roseus]SEC43648.1 Phenylacetate-coenzyme A ligase PaaK, adenylate-forming domain family [Terriglobus roseus]